MTGGSRSPFLGEEGMSGAIGVPLFGEVGKVEACETWRAWLWGRFCGEVGTSGARLAFVEGVGAAFLFPLRAKMECLGRDSMFGARFGVWDVIWLGLLRCGDV